jgi:hypothetical protein
MARRTNDPIQQFRGTTAKHATYIGPAGELTVDTDKNTVVVHDGATAGGFPLAKESTTITASNGLTVTSGGTLAANTNIAGVDATTSAKGVVQLESALSGTANLVPDSAAVKTYVDNAVETYTAAAPLSIDANNEISISAATTAAAGSMSAADKTKLDSLSAMTAAAPLSIDANNEISISAATTTDAGSMSAADKTKLDGITTMTGATSVAAGASGLVPAPAAGDDTAFLKGDGSWGTPPGKTYTATAPVAIDANDDISVADATTSSKGVVQVGDNVTVSSGTISVKPWADYAAASSSVTVSDLQENAIVVTDEPVGGSAEAVLAEVEQTLSNSAGSVPSSAVVSSLARNVGELVHSIVPLTDAGLHLLDGTELQDNGVYAQGIAKIKALQTNYPGLFTTEADWQASVTAHGVCGKFVAGTGTLRLPKITGFMEGTIDSTALGDLVEAGLPNITGNSGSGSTYGYYVAGGSGTGALRASNSNNRSASSNTGAGYGSITFDASLSNAIYGNSQTVQPQAIKGFVYIVLAHYAKTPVQANLDNYATDLNSRATVDMANVNNAGSLVMAHAAMPSSTEVDFNFPSNTGASSAANIGAMPGDGYLTIVAITSAANGYVYIRHGTDPIGTLQMCASPISGGTVAATVAVNAGDTPTVGYGSITTDATKRRIYFRYCNGNAHLAS